MELFFSPRSIALVGASAKPGRIGNEVLKSLLKSQARVYPVNPKRRRILGRQCYRNVNEIPGKVDLAVIAVRADAVPQVLKQCGDKGVKRAIIISGGFKELGREELEEKVKEVASRYGIRVIGPNCIGVLDGATALDTFFLPMDKIARPGFGNISLLTQSGALGSLLVDWLAVEGLGISKFVSYGNKCDVDELDMLRYLRRDDATEVVGVYIEGTGDGRKLMHELKNVSKPVVVLNAGKTRAGAKAAKSHTGALAINARVFTGAMAQSNALVADDLEQMLDLLKILALQPLPQGNRVGIVTNGAGPVVMAVDSLENTGLKLGKLSKTSMEELREQLSDFCVFDNPIDLTGSATAEEFEIALQILVKDPNIDVILPFLAFQVAPLLHSANALHQVFTKIKGKPIIGCVRGGAFAREQCYKLQRAGIPIIPSGSRLVYALDKVYMHARRK